MILRCPMTGALPAVPSSVFVAPTAVILGDVVMGEESSVWFQSVVRGDVGPIRIGARTNVQDLSMLHCTRRKFFLTIGDDVTIGHRVTLHGCTLGSRILVGMGAIIMDGATIEDDCIIGAGALVTQGTHIPKGSLAVGSPARVARALKPEELAFLKVSANNYVGDRAHYLAAREKGEMPTL